MNTLFKTPQLNKIDLKITKEYGYYDGITCGILEYQDRPYYFNMVEDEGDDRYYAIFEMTPEQLVYFSRMDDWWDLCNEVYRDWDQFYTAFYGKFPVDEWPQFAANQAVAWFIG